jgi:hypothetical protein
MVGRAWWGWFWCSFGQPICLPGDGTSSSVRIMAVSAAFTSDHLELSKPTLPFSHLLTNPPHTRSLTSHPKPNQIEQPKSSIPLADYKSKPILFVNVASACGLTPQYKGEVSGH